jgi:alpha-ribazole phosphatase
MTSSHGNIVTTRWWWVRHAPVPDGGNIYGQGDLDCDCSERHVFEAVARTLPTGATWVTSGLKRTIQTADAIVAASSQTSASLGASSSGGHAPGQIPRYVELAEQHLGEWQGQNREHTRRAIGITPLDFWLTKGSTKAPGGESFPDLAARVTPRIETLSRDHAGRNIVAVTHGGTIRAAIQHALGLAGETPHAFVIDNCSVTLLERLQSPAGAVAWRAGGINMRPWL